MLVSEMVDERIFLRERCVNGIHHISLFLLRHLETHVV